MALSILIVINSLTYWRVNSTALNKHDIYKKDNSLILKQTEISYYHYYWVNVTSTVTTAKHLSFFGDLRH